MLGKQVQNIIHKTLKQFGSNGQILHKATPTTNNRYDEDGIETPLTDFTTTKVKYSKKEENRVSIALDKTLKITDSDLFIDNFDRQFAIEKVIRIGDMQDNRVLYQIEVIG